MGNPIMADPFPIIVQKVDQLVKDGRPDNEVEAYVQSQGLTNETFLAQRQQFQAQQQAAVPEPGAPAGPVQPGENPPPADQPWSQVLERGMQNFGRDALETGKGLIEPFVH